MMRRAVSVFLVLGALLALGASAVGKLPPGSTFTACGESGCATAGKKESFELSGQLITPPLIQHVRDAPAGEATWFRVGLDVPRGAREDGYNLRGFVRHFPVAFVPDEEYLGVPNREGAAFAWVHLRPGQVDAYTQLTAGLQPFPEHDLARMNAAFVAQAKGSGPRGDADADTGDGVPASLIVALLAVGTVAGVALVVRARHRRARPAV
jgi:hypothetical protein